MDGEKSAKETALEFEILAQGYYRPDQLEITYNPSLRMPTSKSIQAWMDHRLSQVVLDDRRLVPEFQIRALSPLGPFRRPPVLLSQRSRLFSARSGRSSSFVCVREPSPVFALIAVSLAVKNVRYSAYLDRLYKRIDWI